MSASHKLKSLEICVAEKNPSAMEKLLSQWKSLPAKPEKIREALGRGLERARQDFEGKSYAIPDLLLSIDCYHMAWSQVTELSPEGSQEKLPAVVIGVVEGDVHHMGKNIVAAVLGAHGYEIHDAGKDVSNERFLDLVTQTHASILALSVMMSTPQENMAELIRAVRLVSPQTKIVVGGASMDAVLARKIGADGYAENAVTVPAEFSRLLALQEEQRQCA